MSPLHALELKDVKAFTMTHAIIWALGMAVIGFVAYRNRQEKKREDQLVINNRHTLLGQLSLGIAHEINNPLASVLACAEGLLSRVRKGHYDPQLFEDYLKLMEEEIFRCKNITTSMLSFVRTTREKRDVDINKAIDTAIELSGLERTFDEIFVRKEYTVANLHITGNEEEIIQVFLLIINNAVEAIEDKGDLVFRTGMTKNAQVFAEISDTGPGIPDEYRDRVFEPFFTTKMGLQRAGLGLPIALSIIQDHKGAINIVSPLTKGATVRITLPVLPAVQ